MEKLEYKTITLDTKGFWGGQVDQLEMDKELNTLGNEGWELVSSFATSQTNGITKSVVCVFKRKKA